MIPDTLQRALDWLPALHEDDYLAVAGILALAGALGVAGVEGAARLAHTIDAGPLLGGAIAFVAGAPAGLVLGAALFMLAKDPDPLVEGVSEA